MKAMPEAYAVSLDCPHATGPSVLVTVRFSDETGTTSGGYAAKVLILGDDCPSPRLWIPMLDAWTLDHVRLVLHELSAFLPPDDEAVAGVTLHRAAARGRKPKAGPPRPPRLQDVAFWVTARGWRATINTDVNERTATDASGRIVPAYAPTGEWSDPMLASLETLAERSPFLLRGIGAEVSGYPDTRFPSRYALRAGIDVYEPEAPSREAMLRATIRRYIWGGDDQ
jgi:hypothetical protein